jgi:hypothetical protein
MHPTGLSPSKITADPVNFMHTVDSCPYAECPRDRRLWVNPGHRNSRLRGFPDQCAKFRYAGPATGAGLQALPDVLRRVRAEFPDCRAQGIHTHAEAGTNDAPGVLRPAAGVPASTRMRSRPSTAPRANNSISQSRGGRRCSGPMNTQLSSRQATKRAPRRSERSSTDPLSPLCAPATHRSYHPQLGQGRYTLVSTEKTSASSMPDNRETQAAPYGA